MTALDLRPIEPHDALAVHDLVTRPEVALALGTTVLDSPGAFQQRFLESIQTPGVERLGAFRGPTLVGLAELTRPARARLSHAAELVLAVRGAERRRGVGTALLTAALDVADRWMALVRLSVEILADDTAALRFFERHGFTVEGRCAAALLTGGALADILFLGRVRPGFSQPDGALAPLPEPPPRRPPPKGPLVVRPATIDDVPSLARFSRDPSVLSASSMSPWMSFEDWRKRLETAAADGYTAVVLAGGAIVANGSVRLFDAPRRRHTASLGLHVLAGHQGMGIGERLLTVLLDQATTWLGAERVELQVLTDNHRAVRLYEKHGFTREGVLRYGLWRDGGYADSMVMARLSPRALRP